MNAKTSIWVWNGIIPHRLHGQELALALLLYEKPLSATQLSTALQEKGIKIERRQLSKLLAHLEQWGVVSIQNGRYTCTCKKLADFPVDYSESQLLDLVGMTQSTINGQSFYSAAPPMSVSSRGCSGV